MEISAPRYDTSHALVIGINKYQQAPPLGYAVNDAEAVANVLETKFGFSSVKKLIDSAATGSNIRQEFLKYAENGTAVDDRLVIFFAGHGHTIRGRRGDVGYLVPFDGDVRNLASLIRWDSLTRDADLINAKHVLFVMDACYGGLAISRALKPGASRFLKDMLRRYSRQVLTAGKADEVVSDAGGPRYGHSVFTGHFLDALDGAAECEGYISANGVMAYVYQKVSADPDSEQTPHFGFLSGDGDLIFTPLGSESIDDGAEKDIDVLIPIPGTFQVEKSSMVSIIDSVKEFLAIPESRIKLHDLVSGLIRNVIARTSVDEFSAHDAWSSDEFAGRLDRYNVAMDELCQIQMLLSFWGKPEQKDTVALAVKRMSEQIGSGSGLVAWLALRWYPVTLLIYCCGLGAIASKNYSNLLTVLNATIPDPRQRRSRVTILEPLLDALDESRVHFKSLPGHEKNYVPLSEYLYKRLQPDADDILFIGGDYEGIYDEMEILIALQYAYVVDLGFPFGRFAWKHSNRFGGDGPFNAFVEDAERQGERWAPLQAGFFGGSEEKFKSAVAIVKERLDKLSWW